MDRRPKPRRGRREFLRTGGAAAAAVAGAGVAPAAGAPQAGSERRLDLPVLNAVAEVVLPPEIGDDGIRNALRDFVRWLDGFEPVAELPHPYLSSNEVQYGPADPAPLWGSQLRALDLLATRRHGRGFATIEPETRRRILEADLAGHAADGRLPRPAAASHVAIGLLARFYARGAAADLAYGVRIGAQACRDIPSGAGAPVPLETGGDR